MTDIVLAVVLIGILGGVIRYLYRAKKQGATCIGCPYAKLCGGGCSGDCSQDHAQARH